MNTLFYVFSFVLTALAADLPPSNLNGLIKAKRLLGSGSQGLVYLACVGDKEVAVKVYQKDKNCYEGSTDSILNEFRTIRLVNCENIVALLGAGLDEKFFYLALEYSHGGDTAELLKKLKKFPLPLLRVVAKDILSGLKAVHAAGIIHRDVKLENILISSSGVFKLADFGLSVRAHRLKGNVGSLNYKAPELFDSEYDCKVDLWATGVCVYSMAAGVLPFAVQFASDFNEAMARIVYSTHPDYSRIPFDDVIKILREMFKKDPKERPSALELYEKVSIEEGDRDVVKQHLVLHSTPSDDNIVIEPKDVYDEAQELEDIDQFNQYMALKLTASETQELKTGVGILKNN